MLRYLSDLCGGQLTWLEILKEGLSALLLFAFIAWLTFNLIFLNIE